MDAENERLRTRLAKAEVKLRPEPPLRWMSPGKRSALSEMLSEIADSPKPPAR